MQTIEERIKPIIAEQFCVPVDEVDLSANLVEKYTSDSLDLVELTIQVEDEFGMEVPDETMWGFSTGQQIIDYVRANVKA
jgi:acyl carrier protein